MSYDKYSGTPRLQKYFDDSASFGNSTLACVILALSYRRRGDFRRLGFRPSTSTLHHLMSKYQQVLKRQKLADH